MSLNNVQPIDDLPGIDTGNLTAKRVPADRLEERGKHERTGDTGTATSPETPDGAAETPERRVVREQAERVWRMKIAAVGPTSIRSVVFDREGRPVFCSMEASDFVNAVRFFDAVPIPHVELFIRNGDFHPLRLTDCPHLDRLAGLSVTSSEDEETTNALIRRLGACDKLTRLRSLKLNPYLLRGLDIRPLAQSPHLAGLERLDLSYAGLGTEGAEELARSPSWRNLRELNLEGSGIEDRGAAALAGSPVLAEVRLLNLGYSGLGPQAARSLAHSPHLEKLRELGLRGNAVGREGALALATSSGSWPFLETIDVRHNGLSRTTIRELLTNGKPLKWLVAEGPDDWSEADSPPADCFLTERPADRPGA